jgi:pentatricopeptide repeat protein
MNSYLKICLSRFRRNLKQHRGLSSTETIDPQSQWSRNSVPQTASSPSSAKKWGSIAEKFRQGSSDEREGRKSLLELSKMTANVSVLEKCILDKNVSKAYGLLKAVRVEEIDFKFIKLVLLTCSSAADEVTAERCVEYTRSLNIETTAGIWDALLAVYGESGNYEKAMVLLKKMENVYRIKLNTTNFNKTLKAASKGGNFIEATSLVAGMRDRNIPQDGVTLSTYIQSAVNSKKLSEARKILDDALSSIPSTRGYDVPSHAFHHIMYGYAEVGNTAAIDSLFKSMLAYGVEPDLYTFSILFSAHGRLENRDALIAYLDVMITRGIRMTHRRPWKALKGYFQKTKDVELFSEVVQKLHSAGGSEIVMPEILRDYVTILVAAGSNSDGFKLLENMTEMYSVTLSAEHCKNIFNV